MLTRGLRSVCLALTLTTTSSLAFAQSADDKAKAAKLKTEADRAMDDIQYADALAKYKQAHDLNPDPALLYNEGRAYGALNQYPEALSALEQFVAQASPELKAKVPTIDALIADFRKHTSTVTITCNVPGAAVLLRDKAVGACPLAKPLVVNSGPATVVVSAVDWVTQKKDVVLPDGGAQTIDVQLVKATPASVLVVRSTPAASDGTVDGRAVGATPFEVPVDPGTHKLVLSHSGYRDLATSAVVGRGERKELELQLSQKGVTSKAWFWTVVVVGVGLVAGAVVGIVYAYTTERSPDSGSIPPGKISTGLSF